MLDVLRRNAGSWAIKIVLTFIALTFIWWGVGTYSERDRNVAATVAGEAITMNELSEAVNGLEKTYREVYGPAFTPEMAKALNLKKQAIDSLVQRKILLSEAASMGLSATDEEVQREIAAVPAFQQDGQFREERYRSILSYNRVTPAEYESSKRSEITLKKVEGVIAAGALIPDTEARELFVASSRKIRLLVVTSDPGKMKTEAPTEAEIAAKYEQDREKFRIPARVKLAVAAFTPERFGKEIRPSDAEVQAFYDANPDRFRSEEQRLVSRIDLPYGKNDKEAVRAKALALLEKVSKGKADFEAAAKASGRGKGAERWISRKEAGEALAGPLFQASVDTVTGPVELPGAFVLARVNRIRFPETLPLSKVRDRVVEQLRREKGKDLAVVKAYETHPKAVAAKSLKAVAEAAGVPVVETGGTVAEGAAGVPAAVVQEALLLPVGEVGPVKTVGDSHYLFQVVAKEESRVPPLADVRAGVAAAAAKEKAASAAKGALLRVLSSSNSSRVLEANAKQAGLTATLTDWVSPLSGKLPEALPPSDDLRKELSFLTAKSPVSRKAYPGRAGTFVGLAFAEERLPDDSEWERNRMAFRNEWSERKKSAMIDAFLADRRKSGNVVIHPDALK